MAGARGTRQGNVKRGPVYMHGVSHTASLSGLWIIIGEASWTLHPCRLKIPCLPLQTCKPPHTHAHQWPLQGLKHHEQHVSLTRKQDIVHLSVTTYTPLSPQYPETHPAIINRIAVRCLNVRRRMCKLRRGCWVCRVVFPLGVIRVQICNICSDS